MKLFKFKPDKEKSRNRLILESSILVLMSAVCAYMGLLAWARGFTGPSLFTSGVALFCVYTAVTTFPKKIKNPKK